MTTTDRSVERYVDVDLYAALHLTAEASAELVDKAYRLRLLEVHPDLAGAARTDQTALVNAAGEILRQPTARARYDALRAAHRARAGPSQATPDRAQRQQQRGRRARWLWASGGAGVVAGAVALSVVLGIAGSRPVRAAPVPLVVPAPAAAAVASGGADAEWPTTLHELDATWEQDWPATITRLEGFLDRWPGYPAAEDKLYAALLTDAEGHLQAEQVAAGVAELERAARRQPERGEAWARLAQLATAVANNRP